MKNTFVIVALIGAANAVTLEGISSGKMHHSGAPASDGSTNWRKPWPQGIDNADGDAEVLDMFNRPEAKPKSGAETENYPW